MAEQEINKTPNKEGHYIIELDDGRTFVIKWSEGKWLFVGNEHIPVPEEIKSFANKLFGK